MKASPATSRILAVLFLAGALVALVKLAAHFLFGDVPYVQEPVHEWFELTGTCVALGVAMLLSLRARHQQADSHLLWVAAALTAMGLVDGMDGVVASGVGSWWLGHGGTLVGGVLFSLVWLPLPAVVARRPGRFLLLVGGLSLVGTLGVWWRADWLPVPGDAGANALGGLGFLAAAVFFFRRHLRQARAEDLAFAGQALLFGTASLLFGLSDVWAADWWAWHAVRLLAYGMVLVAAYETVAAIYQESARHAQELESRIQVRTAELRESEGRLRMAQAAGRVGSFDWDLAAQEAHCSEEYFRVMNRPWRPGGKVCLAEWQSWVHPEDRDRVLAALGAALDGPGHAFGEYRMVGEDGQTRWILYQGRISRDPQDRAVRMLGTAQDTTERKRAEEEIRSLSLFPEQNPNPVIRIARDGVLLYANSASARLLTSWKARRGEPVPRDWRERVAGVLASGKVEETEVTFDGRVCSCVLAPVGDQGYVNVYARDVTDHRRAEEALRQAKEDWEETFNTVPDLVAILDRQHRIVRINRAMGERLNLTPEQCIGRHCYEVVHGTSSPTKSCLHAQTCLDGREHTTELEEPRLGGHFLVTTSPRFDEQGHVAGTVHVARDIARLKRAEKALQRLNAELEGRVAEQTAEVRKSYEVAKAERQRLYDLLDTLPVYVVLLSTDHQVPFANRFFRERFGESDGRCCFEYMFQRRVPCENCESHKVLSTGAPHRWAWASPDGRYYDVHDFPFVDTDGSRLILEVGIDITDRTKSRRALEASEARYRSFVTASTQIVWATDAQGLVAGDLPSWRAFTGQSVEQIQAWGWADALHPDDRQRTAAAWSHAVATRSPYTTEYRVRRHDGQYRWLSVRGVPVLADGVLREWVGACTDITERKRAEEEALRREEELAHVDRTARMGELAASLAHELNQPLAAILGNAQAARRLLASGTLDPELFREILDDIIRDDKRAGSVIHRLRLMLQKGKPEPESFEVNDAIREVAQLLHSEITGRNVTLSMDLAPRLPTVRAGRVEVQQVMVNLLLNALDALKDVPGARRGILIRSRTADDAVVVAIRDRGRGIQPPDIDSIFQPFFTTKPVGLGMGLAICRRMIQAHGGRIWAANNEDAGATLSFSLPSTPARPDPEPRDA